MTKKYAVLGSPISHSKSPLIHSTAFGQQGIDAEYLSVELSQDLRGWVAKLDPSWQGLSLTMPLKEQALDLADRADPLAIAAQAANTLIRTEQGWDAYNTDVFGIAQSLSGFKFASVCILGTGATARSAIVAMLDIGKTVRIWGRDQAKVARLVNEFEITPVADLQTALKQPAVISTVVANALDEQLSGPYPGVLLDIVYHPWPTQLSESFAREKVVSGLEMLIWQAVAQQRLFVNGSLTQSLRDEDKVLQGIRTALEMAI
jgi:shikimate dehydrogenase